MFSVELWQKIEKALLSPFQVCKYRQSLPFIHLTSLNCAQPSVDYSSYANLELLYISWQNCTFKALTWCLACQPMVKFKQDHCLNTTLLVFGYFMVYLNIDGKQENKDAYTIQKQP